jgi:hypothetical protein
MAVAWSDMAVLPGDVSPGLAAPAFRVLAQEPDSPEDPVQHKPVLLWHCSNRRVSFWLPGQP